MINKLLEISTGFMSHKKHKFIDLLDLLNGDLSKNIDPTFLELSNSLTSLLRLKDGLIAFESSLHIFGYEEVPDFPSLKQWNSILGWRKYYDLSEDKLLIFFAQDVFASQFAISSNGILRFYPESGEFENHTNSLEEWAAKILNDYHYETGWEIAHEWQINNSFSLGREYRLLPKIPFILGGEYEASNMHAVKTELAMEKLGKLYMQIKSLPDGHKVKITDWI